MLNSKQRATLKSMANGIDTILQVGKGGIADTTIKQLDDALTARELVKIKVLETAPTFAKEVANDIAKLTNSEVVQVIGSRIVLYRMNRTDPKINIGKTY